MFIGNLGCKASLLLDGNELAVVGETKDLGVIVDSHLTFGAHIDQMVAKAFVRSNLIHKCFVSRDVSTLVRAFVVYVRPILEYASCVWSPHHVGRIKQIESVQRRFTKRLPGYATLDYKSRLQRLGMDSLEMRRLRQDLIYTYKIVVDLVDGAANDMFTTSSNMYTTRGHMYKLFPHCSRLDMRKYFFAERVIQPWNALPAKHEHFRSRSAFARFVRCTDLSKFVINGF